MKRLIFWIVFIGLVGGASIQAFAQQIRNCAPRAKFVAEMEQKYNERRVHMGIVNNGHIIEVFASDKGTWTMILTQPTGIACVAATGEGWEVNAPSPSIKKGTAL